MLAMADSAGGISWKLVEEKIHSINVFLSDSESVRWLAAKLGVQPWVLAALGSFWICGFLLWGFTGELVCTVVGLLYPMYGSFKALEYGQPEEVMLWMRYWISYAALSLMENLVYRMLAWVPFYHILRILVVLWLFLPATQGANNVYAWIVGPALRRYSPKIDAMLARSAEEVRDTLGAAAGCAGASELRSVLRKAAATGAGYVAHDLGMEDLMVRELTKTVSGRLGQAACDMTATMHRPGFSAARARVASPAPRCTSGPVPTTAPFENKDDY